MRFNSTQQHSIATVSPPLLKNFAAHTRAETQLARRCADPLAQLGHRRAQPLRILLGGRNRNMKRIGRVEQSANVPNNASPLRNDFEQLHLSIDDEQRRVLGTHQIGTSRKRS